MRRIRHQAAARVEERTGVVEALFDIDGLSGGFRTSPICSAMCMNRLLKISMRAGSGAAAVFATGECNAVGFGVRVTTGALAVPGGPAAATASNMSSPPARDRSPAPLEDQR